MQLDPICHVAGIMYKGTMSDQAKVELAGSAAILWLIVCPLMYVWDGELNNLFSLESIAFLIVGMIAVAIVVGILNYWVSRWLTTRMAAKHGALSSPAAIRDVRRH